MLCPSDDSMTRPAGKIGAGSMESWTWVVGPAVATALLVRLDAILIGPYFSFPQLIYGWEGVEGRHWYKRSTRRYAAVRRFAYPFILGIILASAGRDLADTAASGFLAMGLLLWPAVFHGLPYGVSRRDWQVPAVYASILLAYTGLASAGWHTVSLVVSAGDGDIGRYIAEQARDTLLVFAATTLLSAFFKGSFSSLQERQQERASSGPEYDFDGTSVHMDAPPDRREEK